MEPPFWKSGIRKRHPDECQWEPISLEEIEEALLVCDGRNQRLKVVMTSVYVTFGVVVILMGSWRIIETITHFVAFYKSGTFSPLSLIAVIPFGLYVGVVCIGVLMLRHHSLPYELYSETLNDNAMNCVQTIRHVSTFGFLIGLIVGAICSGVVFNKVAISIVIGITTGVVIAVILDLLTWYLSLSAWPEVFQNNKAFLSFANDVRRFLLPPISLPDLMEDTPINDDPEEPLSLKFSSTANELSEAVKAGMFDFIKPCPAIQELKRTIRAWWNPQTPPRRWWQTQVESIRQKVWKKLKGKQIKKTRTETSSAKRDCPMCGGRGRTPERTVYSRGKYMGQKWVVRPDGAEFSAPVYQGGGEKTTISASRCSCVQSYTVTDITTDRQLYAKQIPRMIEVINSRIKGKWG